MLLEVSPTQTSRSVLFLLGKAADVSMGAGWALGLPAGTFYTMCLTAVLRGQWGC